MSTVYSSSAVEVDDAYFSSNVFEQETPNLRASHIAQPVYGSWGVVYPSACASYSSNDVNVIDVDVSIVNNISIIEDDFLFEALEEFNDDNSLEYSPVATEAVAMPVEEPTVFAFAVPEGYLHGMSTGQDLLAIKSDDLINPDKSDLFIDEYFDELIKKGYLDDLEFSMKIALVTKQFDSSTNEKLIKCLNKTLDEKSSNRNVSASRWRDKREKKRLQNREGVKLPLITTARQSAAAKRIRVNGKFKKNETKWIPVNEFKLTESC